MYVRKVEKISFDAFDMVPAYPKTSIPSLSGAIDE
jgi:hypothetical protein